MDGKGGIDAIVWNWIHDLFMEPASGRVWLEEQQNRRDRESEPLRNRFSLVEELLAENEARAGRLLELYLDETFTKDQFKKQEGRLRETGEGLKIERAELLKQLDARRMSDDQMRAIEDVAQEIAGSLDSVEDDFATERQLIELLDVHATLVKEW